MIAILDKTKRSIAGYIPDATINEDHRSEVQVTENPVEFGVSVNDHRILKPRKYTVTGRVSNYPLDQGLKDQWQEGNEATRSQSAYAILEELQRTGDPFDVQSGLKLYRNMVITMLSVSQDKSNSGVLDFVATMQEVIIVSTETKQVALPEPGPTEEQASPTKELGEVHAKEVTDLKMRSILAWIIDEGKKFLAK